ncbi:MAG: ArsA family ATPase [Salinibacter sp.]
MSSPSPPFLRSPPFLLLFGGKGGVGKTTCAAAAALRLSRRGLGEEEKVLLLSTDPAHSLGDCLQEAERPASLEVEEFDASAALRQFREQHRGTLHEIVARGTFFDDADIQELLDLALPGLDETMAVLRLARLADEETYTTVVVDTAPTGHTLRLLEMPERFEMWVDFLDVLLEKHRYMRARFAGKAGSDPLDAFVEDLQAQARSVLRLLRDDGRTSFVVVTRPEDVVLRETRRLVDDLQELEIPVQSLALNRWPEDPGPSGPQALDLRPHHEWLSDHRCWALPDLGTAAPSSSLPDLWSGATRLDAEEWTQIEERGSQQACTRLPSVPSEEPHDAAVPRVKNELPLPDHMLWLFAGKGGVGKTTLASATALRLAEDAQHRGESARDGDARVLLMSTDPAHSLSDVLGTEVQPDPTPVTDRLDALHIEAASRLEQLRDDYVEEVQQFFSQTGSTSFDLPHARTVTEHLMDLVPPGVDEIVGLSATLEQLTDGRYDRIVLDTAPTGHFFRFIEMPDVFEAWIQAFFRLLRKYRRVVRAPALKDRLVRLSKQVKRLRRILGGPESENGDHESERDGKVYGVATPGDMVLAETRRLSRRLSGRLSMPALFLNKVDPESAVFSEGERRTQHGSPDRAPVQRFKAAFEDLSITIVERQHPPQGIEPLRRLGRALYA